MEGKAAAMVELFLRGIITGGIFIMKFEKSSTNTEHSKDIRAGVLKICQEAVDLSRLLLLG